MTSRIYAREHAAFVARFAIRAVSQTSSVSYSSQSSHATDARSPATNSNVQPDIGSPDEFLPALQSLQSALHGVATELRGPAVASAAAGIMAPVASLARPAIGHLPVVVSGAHHIGQPSATPVPTFPASLTADSDAPPTNKPAAQVNVVPFAVAGGVAVLFVLAIISFRVYRKSRAHAMPLFSPMFGGRTPEDFENMKKAESWQKFEELEGGSVPSSLSAARDFPQTQPPQNHHKNVARPVSATPPSTLLAMFSSAAATKAGVKTNDISKPQPAPVGLGFDSRTNATIAVGHYSIQVPTKRAPTPKGQDVPPMPEVMREKEAMSITMTGVGAFAGAQLHVQRTEPTVMRQPSVKIQPLLERRPSGYKFPPSRLPGKAPPPPPPPAPSVPRPAFISRAQSSSGSQTLTEQQTKSLTSALGLASPPSLDVDLDVNLYRYTRYDESLYPDSPELPMQRSEPLSPIPLPHMDTSPNTALGQLLMEVESTPIILTPIQMPMPVVKPLSHHKKSSTKDARIPVPVPAVGPPRSTSLSKKAPAPAPVALQPPSAASMTKSPSLPYLAQDDVPVSKIPVPARALNPPLSAMSSKRVKRVSLLPRLDFPLPPVTIPAKPAFAPGPSFLA